MVALAFLALVIILHACREPTQMRIVLTTDVPCSDLKGIAITVAGEAFAAEERGARIPSTTTSACAANGEVGTLVITPGAGGAGAIVVVAGVLVRPEDCAPPKYAGCIVARRRFSFAEATSLDIPIELTLDCRDVPCEALTTCKRGGCIDSAVECDGASCIPPLAKPDAGPPDGAADGNPAQDAANDGLTSTDGPSSESSTDAATDAPKDGTSMGTGKCDGTNFFSCSPDIGSCDGNQDCCAVTTDINDCRTAGSCNEGGQFYRVCCDTCAKSDWCCTVPGGNRFECRPKAECGQQYVRCNPLVVAQGDCPAGTTCGTNLFMKMGVCE